MTDSIWMKALLAALSVVMSAYLPAGCLLATAGGCNMNTEFGEMAAQYPGVHVKLPSLFAQGEMSFTSNGDAKVERAEYHGASPDGGTGASLIVSNAQFGQDVVGPMKEVPEILEKLPPILVSRVQITHEICTMVPELAEAVVDGVSPIAAGAHALREIFKSAHKEPTPEIADLLTRIDSLEQAAKDARAMTQPVTP